MEIDQLFKDFGFEFDVGWFDNRNAQLAKKHEFGEHAIMRSHILKVASSPEFYEYIKTDYIANKVSSNPTRGGQVIAEAFIRFYKNFVLAKKVTPALSPVTIRLKRNRGSKYATTPLVDTKQMINAITYKIIR